MLQEKQRRGHMLSTAVDTPFRHLKSCMCILNLGSYMEISTVFQLFKGGKPTKLS